MPFLKNRIRHSVSWLLLTLSLASVGSVLAQQQPRYVQRVWDTEDGLPLRRLLSSSMVQTQDGYLWIGTRVGLVRFDGVRFKRFAVDNTADLPENWITNLFESKDGSLWIATWKGNLLRYRDRTFQPFLSEEADTQQPSYITSFVEDRQGTLWISTHRGIMRLVDDRFELFPLGDRSPPVESMWIEDDGTIWFTAGQEGVFRLRDGESTHFGADDGLANDFSLGIFRSDDGRIWVAHPQGKISYIDSTGAHAFTFPGAEKNQLHFLSLDARRRLWLSVGPRLYHFRDNDWAPVSYGEELPELFPESFSLMRTVIGENLDQPWFSWELAQLGEMVPDRFAPPPPMHPDSPRRQSSPSYVFRDQEENVWLSGFQPGLVRMKPALFETVPTELFSAASEGDEREEFNIRALGESSDGSIWMIGLLSSLIQQLPDGTYQRYGTAPEFSFPSWSFTEDRTGTVWINGAICHRGDRGTCDRFESVSALQNRVIKGSLEDADGTLWFGGGDGLSRFVPTSNPTHPDHGEWTHFNTTNGLPHDDIESMVAGRSGGLWLGTNGGGLVHLQDDTFSQWTTAHGLSGNNIQSVHQDQHGVLWLGSDERGLMRVEVEPSSETHSGQKAIRVTPYRQEQGLFATEIASLAEDPQGRLWIGSRQGIFWVSKDALEAYAKGDLQQVQSTAYTTADGLTDHETNSGGNAVLRSKDDGKLWFATQYGAAVVDPSEVKPNPIAPPVVIESARSRLTPISLEDESAVFQAEQRDFDITYTGLSLATPSLVRFRYKLEGYDDDWVDAGTDRTATYTQVPSGTYSFRVIAANNDGVWNEEGATLSVRVKPFFWETWWFRSIALLSVIALAVVADRVRVRRLVDRKRLLENRVAERTMQLRKQMDLTESQANRLRDLDKLKSQSFENISHEFRTPLTLIMGPLQQLLSGKQGTLPNDLVPQHEMMLRHSGRLLRLTNQILDLARMDSGLFKPTMKKQDFISMVREAVHVFSPLAERKGIKLVLEGASNPDGSPHFFELVYDREMMRKVVANLLSNALKFTEEHGTVTIAIRTDSASVELDVSDTGPGIPEDSLESVFTRFSRIEDANKKRYPGTGIGLSIVKEFTEAHDGTVRVRSEMGSGTTFTIALPVHQGNAQEAYEETSSDALTTHSQAVSRDTWLDLEPDLLPITGESEEELQDQEDRITVLVVDDNDDIRSFIRSLLEGEYKVLEASDGQQGLEVAREFLPDLIIADVMMPRMDGLEFNRELKRDRSLSTVPIILLTARATPADYEAGLATEVDQYLTKPFDPDVLMVRIQSLLRIRHRLSDLLRQDTQEVSQDVVLEHPSTTESTSVPVSVFVENVMAMIRENLSDPDFGVDELAERMMVSRWQLRRRLVENAGLTPNALIRQIRLEEASKLFLNRAGNVSEVAYAVGFQSLSHFSRCFKAQFDMSPSEYASAHA
jgi:signal transduction histidine kinase/ligand-binding sensor domain-containing protein/AraC-like DNA-binding protein/FixJ family two-component response regulator